MLKPVSSTMSSCVIDVIIPVYKNLDMTRRCIESVLAANTRLQYCLIVVNDASPESEVTAYLSSLAVAEKIILIENKENSGFVMSVNIGMQQHLQRDVVLLNSDTIVANDWLDRLYQCAQKEDSIATVTPFSNNATICSYPRHCEENTLSPQYSLSEIDSFFANCNAGAYLDIPTAVGFCMLIKRDCLNQIGYFDAQRFGKGYGEENDFCMRAVKAGWRNVIACDVFVYHEGSVSFGASKNERIEAAQKILQKLYPHYNSQVQKFIVQDKLLSYRQRVDLQRLRLSKLPTYLLIMHEGEGGVLKHVKDLVNHFDQQINFLILIPRDNQIKLYWANTGESFCVYFDFKVPALLLEFLKVLQVDRLHIHHTLGWEETVAKIVTVLAVPYDVTIHDYFTFCPQINLTNKQGFYCELPELSACQTCVNDRMETRGLDIVDWRKKNQALLENAERVFLPNISVLAIISRYFSKINFVLAPHLESQAVQQACPPTLRFCHANAPLKILIIGALSRVKGADILEQCAELSRKNHLPLEFHLLGFAYRKLKNHAKFYVHGKYDESNIQALIKKINPHIAWFPSLWPETYSYTLSACLEAQLPIVSSDLGAQAERLKGRSFSYIKPWQLTPEEWTSFFLEFKSQSHLEPVPKLKASREEQHFRYDAEYCIVNHAKKIIKSDINLLLEQINSLEFKSFKCSRKQSLYFFLLKIYSNLRIDLFLPRERIIYLKIIFQKFLLSGR